uniref:CCHC-type domain-containing protein n=1 Tax=Timema monikensis TaxID=170555 RepID=A0A7R9EIZ2_9NEOP|nr:unnamed protein product [Timema monikensis]
MDVSTDSIIPATTNTPGRDTKLRDTEAAPTHDSVEAHVACGSLSCLLSLVYLLSSCDPVVLCSLSCAKPYIRLVVHLEEHSWTGFGNTRAKLRLQRLDPALREQQCSLYLAVPPSSPPPSYVRMRTTVKHHVAGTVKRTVPYKDFCIFFINWGMATDPGTSGSGPAGKAKGKIPPIILCDVEGYSKLARAIRSKVREPVEAVRQPGDRVRLQCGSEEDYRALLKFLPSLGIQHWSYELGRERLVRVVVKGLLTRTNPDDIQEELVEMGFPVKSITQMLSQWKRDQKTGERQRLPNFVVSLTPGEHTARLYSISVLCGLRVRVEKYKSPGGPVQCKNCFRFGHVRRDCRANPRCGFCGGDHERGGCPEERRSPPKCLHCSGAHSSAWRGCPTYKSLRAAGNVRASKPQEGRTDGPSEGQKPSGHVAGRRAKVTPAPTPKPLVQSFASVLSKRDTPPPQAEAPAEATKPEPVESSSTPLVEGPPETAPLPIPTHTAILHPSNPFLPLPTPTLVTPTPEDDAAKLKNCIELLKGIPGLDPWDFSSSLLRKVQESPRMHPNRGPPVLKELTVALWNANGVAGKKAELESFLAKHRVDVMLLGETHLRSAMRFSLAEFICHRSDRAGDVGRGGTAVLVRRGLDHHVVSLPPLQHMEATAIQLVTSTGPVRLISIYFPPYHRFDQATGADMEVLLRGTTPVLIGGDFNAKHPSWGSRIMCARGGLLRDVIDLHGLVAAGPPTPTHFPFNPGYLPDVLDFVVSRGIRRRLVLKSLAELDSDHNPVLVNLGRAVSFIDPPEKPDLKRTDWDRFTNVLRERLGPTPTFRTAAEIDRGAEFITSAIKGSLEASTPRHRPKRTPQASLPDSILRHVREKNRLRKAWQISRDPVDKANWSRKVHAVREMVREYRNSVWEDKIESLCVQDRSLWQMTRNLMRVPAPRPPIVSRNGVANSDQEKADALAEHLEAQFVPTDNPSDPVHVAHVAQVISAVSRSALSTRNGLTLYKQLLRPILDYACPAWGHLADTYMRRMQAFQSVCLRIIVGAPWYVRNETLHRDLDMPTIKDHFRKLAQSFYARLPGATNPLIQGLGNYVIDPGGCHRRPKALLG